MTLPSPVAEFYEELWNRRDRSRIDEILHPDVSFRGFAPTGEMVEWQGAALFEIDSGLITSVWVRGDLIALDALLDQQARRSR